METIIEYFLSPYVIVLTCLLAGNALLLNKKYQNKGRLLCLMAIFTLLLSSMEIISDKVLNKLEFQYPPFSIENASCYRTIVVLSGWAERNPKLPISSQINHSSLSRLCEAIRIYRANENMEIIIAGGGPHAGIQNDAISEVIADLANSMGIPKSKIACENRSQNTFENAYYLKDLLAKNKFILVTSSMHMPRAMAVFKSMGMNPDPAPTDYRSVYGNPARGSGQQDISEREVTLKMFLPKVENIENMTLAFHEYLGMLWYKIKGYTG